jgi:peptidoglycan/LPS O-acetylase OafA/YrhL
MGSLRFFLALSVAYGHAKLFLGFPLVPGDTAVQAFFAISGFYMALVLHEKYPKGFYVTFLANRFFRLFPVYALVLIAVVALAFAFDQALLRKWADWRSWNLGTQLFLFASQASMFGLDWYGFLGLSGGALEFAPYNQAARSLYDLMPIPQGWALGVELTFYLMAPAIVRRPLPVLVAVLLASVALRLGLQFIVGFSGDPWSYRFFPSELALFMCGAIAYRVYRDERHVAMFVTLVAIVGAAVLANRWHGVSRVLSVTLLLGFIISIPWLFRLTRSMTWDRLIGETSYPLYICHEMVGRCIDVVRPGLDRVTHGFLLLGLAIALAVALYWFIDRPVDAMRARLVVRAAAKR